MERFRVVSRAELTQVAKTDWDRTIATIAACQHGVVTRAQMLAIGISSGAIRTRVASGRLYRLYRGVYAVGYRPGRPHGNWMAAVLACGQGAVLSYVSAGALWQLRASSATLIDVTSPTRAGRGRDGIRAHSAESLLSSHRTAVDGVPCTTVARTIVDLAGVLATGPLEYVIHRAQTTRKFDRDQVIAVLESAPTRPGTAALRRILGIASLSEDEINSELERRLLRICRGAGVPEPRVNYWIALPDSGAGGFEVDFCWPEHKLIVETDSRTHHDTDRAFENDPHRDRLLMLVGWRVVRFTYRNVTERPDDVAAQLRRFLTSSALQAA